ncbi:hypothetical protein L2E82_13630 [Cichorium intybus]|uniref:Uncharacterized protein n=1 Tax=Cichorium intybus TaxID=13427 RepID=A0ACB9EXQ6_CICIN|nr:hypothetical protein L2E82_13630 [Cichorium intybus]
MKVNVKTLKGTRFEIEVKLEDTVADVKKHIEIVQGPDVYPSTRQMLIHQGKVLKNHTTMEENEVSDDSSIVIMLSNMPETRTAPPPIPVAAPPSQPCSSSTNPPSDLPPITGAPPPPAANQPQANQSPPPAAPSTGPNSSPLNLFPQGRFPSLDDEFLYFLRNCRRFQDIGYGGLANTKILQVIFQYVRMLNENKLRQLHVNLDDFCRLIFELVGGEDGITREDMDTVDRLEAMGFDRTLVWVAFFASDKNEELAISYLRNQMS